MASSTAKRVLLYRFDRQPIEGLVNPSAYLLETGVEWISTTGALQATSYSDVKAVCFISETAAADLFVESSLFERRPKVAGLWARFYFRDGDQLDGVLGHNLLEWPQAGFLFTPPKSGASRGRVFVPKSALIATELRGVVGLAGAAPSRTTVPKTGSDAQQLRMFDR